MTGVPGVGDVIQIAWSLIVLFGSALFRARTEGWAVILLLIIPVTCWAARSLLLNKKRLDTENDSLERYRTEVAKQKDRDGLLKYIEQQPRDTTVGSALYAVYGFRRAESIDIEAIATLLNQREGSHLGFARLSPNLLLLFGLFGTVLGLAGAVGELSQPISQALSAESPEVLTSALQQTLSHMQTAFSCTLWGILCATMISNWTRRVAAKQNQLIAEIQQFVIHDVAPVVVLGSERAQVEDLRAVIAESQKTLASISAQIQTVSNQFKEQMQSITALLGQNVDEFAKTLNDSLSRAETVVTRISDVSQQVAGSLGSAVESIQKGSDALQHAAESVSNSASQLGQYHSRLTEVQDKILQTYESAQKNLEDQISRQIGELSKLQGALDSHGAETIARIDRTVERMEKVAKAVAEGTETAKSEFLSLQNAVSHHYEGIKGSIKELFEKHQNQLSAVDQAVLKVADRLKDLKHSLNPQELPVEEWRKLLSALQALSSNHNGDSAVVGELRKLREIFERNSAVVLANSPDRRLRKAPVRRVSILDKVKQWLGRD
jgi:DNA repair exonuclease SbcCD ATPase subunit